MIGLFGTDPYWQELLRQEGISFTVGTTELEKLDVLIIDRIPSASELAQVRKFADSGGGILTDSLCASAVWPQLRPRKQRSKYIVPDSSPLFRNVGIVDLNTDTWLLQQANVGTTQNGISAISVERISRGWCVLLPFRLSTVLAATGSKPRVFYARTRKQVYEIVATVGRGEVRRLISNALRFLLAEVGLPYVHIHYCRPGQSGVFGFRVDTDFDSLKNMQFTRKIADEVGMHFSWYINTKAHGQHLTHMRNSILQGHDVQIHCYEHELFPDYENNLIQLKHADSILRKAGFRPIGAAAPYGEWNPEWNKALSKLGFLYSSDFALVYDDLPTRPVIDGKPSSVLQIPVHPICLGRLAASRADSAEMIDYFKRYIELQTSRFEPCFLYGHPANIARFPSVIETVLKYGLLRCGSWSSLTDYARWWQERGKAEFRVGKQSGKFVLETTRQKPELEIMIEWQDRYRCLPFRSGSFDLDKLSWQPLPPRVAFNRRTVAARRHDRGLIGKEILRQLRKRIQIKGRHSK